MQNCTEIRSRVVNINDYAYSVYIGRPSKWGNPYKIGVDGTRKEVLEKYRNYLLNNKELLDDIMSLDGEILGCFCKPKACHGDIIIETIEALKRERFLGRMLE